MIRYALIVTRCKSETLHYDIACVCYSSGIYRCCSYSEEKDKVPNMNYHVKNISRVTPTFMHLEYLCRMQA